MFYTLKHLTVLSKNLLNDLPYYLSVNIQRYNYAKGFSLYLTLTTLWGKDVLFDTYEPSRSLYLEIMRMLRHMYYNSNTG